MELQAGIPTTTGTAQAETLRRSFPEIVPRPNAVLGAATVSAVAGAKDPEASYRWQKENGSIPTNTFQARNLLAHGVWMMVSDIDGEQGACQWLLAANRWRDAIPPLEATNRSVQGCNRCSFGDVSRMRLRIMISALEEVDDPLSIVRKPQTCRNPASSRAKANEQVSVLPT